MALLSTLVDDFNDDQIGPQWPLSYGGAAEVGGRARVPCSSVSYAGYQTDTIWTFDQFSLQVPTFPALAGATVECYTSAWIFSGSQDGGTHVGFLGDHTTGSLYFMSRVGYVDAAATSVVLDPVVHRWWRLRLSGPDLLWDTSPDGITWTNRRTLTAPAWLTAASDCKLLLESHRNSGTDNFSEFDNVNVSPVTVHTTAGSAAGAGGLTGTATRTVFTSATPAGLAGASGTAAVIRQAAGTAAATTGLTGVTTITKPAAGAATGTAAAAGAAAVTRATAGTAAATAGLTGTTAVTSTAAATAAAAGTAAGTAHVARAASGTVTGASTLGGTASLLLSAGGTAAGTGTLTGVTGLALTTSGPAAGIGEATGTTLQPRHPGTLTAGVSRPALAAARRRPALRAGHGRT